MLTPRQCRMARAGLRWTLDEVARRAGVSRVTVSRFELEQAAANPSTMTVIRQAFEKAGVEFTPDGVRFREQPEAASS
jgi:transcriptional regulator with XRE-family HTH domain